jgi:putative ABC transport system permease protein
MSIILLRGAAEQGFLYALVALGLYLSFRTLNIADMTTDGTFTLGAACSATITLTGHPVLGLLAGALAGVAAGLVTALLQTKLRIQPILAGLITMTALYSINLKAMGNRSNVPLLRVDTVFSLFESILPAGARAYAKLILAGIITAVVAAALIFFLRTRIGLSVRATGDNRMMVSASSINPEFTTAVGIALANAMVALSGALVAQYQLFSEITMGTGMVVIGLASLIIGEVFTDLLFKSPTVPVRIIGAIGGAVVYRIIIAAALSASVAASDLKLVSAVIVAVSISGPAVLDAVRLHRMRREANRNVDA